MFVSYHNSLLEKSFFSIFCCILFLGAGAPAFAKKTAAKTNPFQNDKQRISYAFGALQAARLEGSLPGIAIDVASFQSGMTGFDENKEENKNQKKKLRISEDAHEQVIAQLREGLQKKAEDEKYEISKETLSDISYVIGYSIAKSVDAEMGSEVEIKQISQGYADALSKKELLLSEEELEKYIDLFQKQYEAPRKPEEKANYDKGQKYLEENKKKKDVVTTPSGLQYKIIKKGNGKKPQLNDQVKVHYRGTLVDGSEFDSSYSRNEPAIFPLTSVIAGWTEILQMMPVGSKWQVFIPQELGYGRQDSGPIKAFSALIFEIELLEIVAPEDGDTD